MILHKNLELLFLLTKNSYAYLYCGLFGGGIWTGVLEWGGPKRFIPEFVLSEYSFVVFPHSFDVPLLHIVHQLPVSLTQTF